MSDQFKVPGIYVEETRLPHVIESQPSAVPCFVGYSKQAVRPGGESLHLVPARVGSLVEFEQLFGGPHVEAVRLSLRTNALAPAGLEVESIAPPAGVPSFSLYWSIRQYFENGGGPCFVISVGTFGTTPRAQDLITGIGASTVEPSLTLMVVPDAAALDYPGYQSVVEALLRQCGAGHGRFAILDVWRGATGPDTLVDLAQGGSPSALRTVIDASRDAWTGELQHAAAYYPHLVSAYSWAGATTDRLVRIVIDGTPAGTLARPSAAGQVRAKQIRQVLSAQMIVVPPSGAVAGVYARVDAARGVWKAPANEALNGVIRPAVPLTDRQQSALNVDPPSGKSIDVIRQFAGKGTLVWGGRTLAGNDSEWRYISVRRLVDVVERSIRHSTAWVAFEANDAATWQALLASVENYLTTIWRAGGLMGSTTREAFFAQCGLGQTMTAADVANGRVILLVGLAAIRPAEFILLRLEYTVGQP